MQKPWTLEELKESGKKARQQFERFHLMQHLHRFLNGEIQDIVVPDKSPQQFLVETDEWGAWMERQLNLPRLIFRSIYRLYRHLRAY